MVESRHGLVRRMQGSWPVQERRSDRCLNSTFGLLAIPTPSTFKTALEASAFEKLTGISMAN